jgi:hypothetical protein
MINRLKITIVLTPLILVVVVVVYVYSLWSEERRKDAERPQEAVMTLVRDLRRYHEKRGGFPETLGKLEKVVWIDKKKRDYSANKRGLNHRNYYYFYSRIGDHQFTLWAIPTGKYREDAATFFIACSPTGQKIWKGPALPIEQVGGIRANPKSILSAYGLIPQE